MKSYNLFDGDLDLCRHRPGFAWRRAAVGERIGAEKLGASVYSDVVCFREGPEGAHQIRNDTDGPICVLVLSTEQSPDAAVCPDSGRIGIWPGNPADPGRLFRLDSDVDYWDGEA